MAAAIWSLFRTSPKVEISTVGSQLQEKREAVNSFAEKINIRRDYDVGTKVKKVNDASILLDNAYIALDNSGVLAQDVNKVSQALWSQIENVRDYVRQCLGDTSRRLSHEKLIDSLPLQDWQPKLKSFVFQIKDGSCDIIFSGVFKNAYGYRLEMSTGKVELGKVTQTEVPFKITGLTENRCISAKFIVQYNAGWSLWSKTKEATYHVWIKV